MVTLVTCRKQTADSGNQLLLFVYLPIIDMYPAVYVWYEYNTNPNLVSDRSETVSKTILLFVGFKVILYVISVLCVTWKESLEKKATKSKSYKLLYKLVVQYKPLYAVFNGIQLCFVYFYFSRYIIPGREIPLSIFINSLFFIFLHLPKLIIYTIKVLQLIPVCNNRCEILNQVLNHGTICWLIIIYSDF